MVIKVRVSKDILKGEKLYYIKTAPGHCNNKIFQTDSQVDCNET